eukprot:scaffold339577_cov54-Attheya_sp.AAC.1
MPYRHFRSIHKLGKVSFIIDIYMAALETLPSDSEQITFTFSFVCPFGVVLTILIFDAEWFATLILDKTLFVYPLAAFLCQQPVFFSWHGKECSAVTRNELYIVFVYIRHVYRNCHA